MINKVNRALLERKHGSEIIYQNFLRAIENANFIISNYQKEDIMRDSQVYFDYEKVAFGALFIDGKKISYSTKHVIWFLFNFKNKLVFNCSAVYLLVSILYKFISA